MGFCSPHHGICPQWSPHLLDNSVVDPGAHSLDDLLLLFDTPTGLSPEREHNHHICLLPATAPIAVRPYRYAHFQKQELERQCADMLQTDVIHPSSSAFYTPVLLVKKSDDTWRFYVDYRALNDVTMKDKFLIPVVEEQLDKLHGTTTCAPATIRYECMSRTSRR
jgi:hypothetical protein